MKAFTHELSSETETAAFGAALAPHLRSGDVICLIGPLGAGKTTFSRGLIKAFSGAQEVPSPTFTLVETYIGANGSLRHFDLYRLENPRDLWELGLEEALEDGVSLIEWPEKAADALPADRMDVTFEIRQDGSRVVKISAPKRWAHALRQAGIA